jgi:hypothetical protein
VRQLEGQLTGQDVTGLQAGTTVTWALDSHHEAAVHAYHIPPSHRLAGAYYDANEPVVDKQLERAGVRLARILNEVLQ